MGVHKRVSERAAHSGHFVQFFDSDDSRHEAAARFLVGGNADACPIVLIARPLNSAAIVDRLAQAGVPVQRGIASGRVTILDGDDTLRRLSRNGTPDAEKFDDIVGPVVMRASRFGRVCAYGEMVDLLAQRGDFPEATLLEGFWNALAARVELSLMCGYSAAHFVSPSSHDALREICECHTSVRVESQDALAAWLLDTASGSAGAIPQ